METNKHWIFYLKMKRNLSDDYLYLDDEFKKHNKSLIPVNIKDLTEYAQKTKSVHVLIVVRNQQEYQYFMKKVQKLLKYMLLTDKVHIYVASSYRSVNDHSIMKRDYFHFVKLPVKISHFCESISEMIDHSESRINSWPGGRRPRLSLAA